MAVFSYVVKKRSLTDVEKRCMMGKSEVLSSLSPRQLRSLHCADFQFPNGDTFVLRPKDVDLTSAEVID